MAAFSTRSLRRLFAVVAALFGRVLHRFAHSAFLGSSRPLRDVGIAFWSSWSLDHFVLIALTN